MPQALFYITQMSDVSLTCVYFLKLAKAIFMTSFPAVGFIFRIVVVQSLSCV